MSVEVIQGNAREVLRGMAAGSVHCAITSPPYWGLRRYEAPDVVWGGEEGCQHEWAQHIRPAADGTLTLEGNSALRAGHQGDKSATMKPTVSAFCSKCNAWRGQLGAEPQIEMYVAHLVDVFREVRRVLRPDGTLFLNLGDSMAVGKAGRTDHGSGDPTSKLGPMRDGIPGGNPPGPVIPRRAPPGLKAKDLCEIPSRVALALQQDGWWLRSRIPWIKQNCLPESVTDRPTNAIEYWFMLTPNARYYWDPESVRMAQTDGSIARWGAGGGRKPGPKADSRTGKDTTFSPEGLLKNGRNRRNSDWLLESFQGLILDDFGGPLCMLVNPEGYDAEYCRACQRYYDGPDKKLVRVEKYVNDKGEKKERRWCLCGRHDAWLSHYATFPERIVEPIIRAATSEKGCCPKCGAGWRRITEKSRTFESGSGRSGRDPTGKFGPGFQGGGETIDVRRGPVVHSRTVDWRPGCACDEGEPIPAVVCDPFSGTGTLGVVAERLGRDAVLIEVSPDYVVMSCKRLEAARREPPAECDGALPLFQVAIPV